MSQRQQPFQLPKATVVYNTQKGNAAHSNVSPYGQRRNIDCALPTQNAFTPAFYSRRKLLSRNSVQEDQPHPGNTVLLSEGNKTSKPANVVQKKDCLSEVYGTSLTLNSLSRKIPGTSGLETDCSAEKKSSLPKDRIGTGGVLANRDYKDHRKATTEEFAAPSLSNNPRTAQHNSNSSKQESFHSCSGTDNQDNNSMSRDLNKCFIQMPSNSSDVPTNFVHTNSLVHSFMKRATSEKSHRNDNGDFCKRGNEITASGSYPTQNRRSDVMLSTFKRQLKRGNDNVKGTLPVEDKDIPESVKRNKALLKSFKNINTNLKPDPIEEKEDMSSSSENDTFSYPDFLPPPYNTLDLQKLSKVNDWRSDLTEPLDQPFDQLVSRLVRMERLQRMTIFQEKTKETVSPAVAVKNSSGDWKNVHQLKQPRSSGFLSSHEAFDGDHHNFGGCVHEPHIPKCSSQHCHKKRTSGGLSPARSTIKHQRASDNTSKCHKAPVTVDSTNAVAQRSMSCSGSLSKIYTGDKITSKKLLSSSTVVGCSLPDNENSKYKQAKTKRKPYRTNGAVMDKPINSQRLSCFPGISKQKHSEVD